VNAVAALVALLWRNVARAGKVRAMMNIKIVKPVDGSPLALSVQTGAWQRLAWMFFAVTFATSIYVVITWLIGSVSKLRLIIVGVTLTVVICLELFAFLRFRHLVRDGRRSESQQQVEAGLQWLPMLSVATISMKPEQSWDSADNLFVIALAISLLLLSWRTVRKQAAIRVATEVAREKAELERQLSEAKLVALSAQIEPHFLFNTLASIQYLIRNDTNKAGEMTSDLIRYLRLALPRMKEATARLTDELDLVRAYLGIMQIRMGSRLQFTIDSPNDLSDVQIPTMTLITLVENAIKHGLEQKPNGGAINLAASRDAYDPLNLRLEVADTGGGFSTAASGTGIGLANIRERLNTLYGTAARLELEANQPSGVKAILIFPIEKK
jgi:two-component sensor histidine kinase